jgi:hypothetical protein
VSIGPFSCLIAISNKSASVAHQPTHNSTRRIYSGDGSFAVTVPELLFWPRRLGHGQFRCDPSICESPTQVHAFYCCLLRIPEIDSKWMQAIVMNLVALGCFFNFTSGTCIGVHRIALLYLREWHDEKTKRKRGSRLDSYIQRRCI